MPTVCHILKDYLLTHNYNALVNTLVECGCSIDDLMPCSDCPAHCEPGHSAPDPDDPDETLFFPGPIPPPQGRS
jgi:hypothetical protein